MLDINGIIFYSNQFFFGILALCFIYSAWSNYWKSKNEVSPGFSGNIQNPKRHLLNLVSIFAVVGVGVCLFLFDSWGIKSALLAMSFSVLIVFSIFQPGFGLGLLIFLLVSRPWETFDDQIMSNMLKDMSIVVLLGHMGHSIIKREFYIKWNRGYTFLALFALWSFFSAFIYRTTTNYADLLLKAIILFFLIINIVRNREDLFAIKISIILAIINQGVTTYLYTLFGPKIDTSLITDPTMVASLSRLNSVGMLGDSNDISAFFVILFCLLIIPILKIKKIIVRILLLPIAVGPILGLIYYSQSRGAILALMVVFSSYFAMRIKNKKMILLSTILILAMVFPVFNSLKRNAKDLAGSTSSRTNIWMSGIHMAVKRPIFGVGFDRFPLHVHQYALNPLTFDDNKTAHSSWILVLGESGWAALFFLLLFYLTAIKKGWELRRIAPEYFLALMGYGTAITFLTHSYTVFPYLLTGVTFATYSVNIDELERRKLCEDCS